MTVFAAPTITDLLLGVWPQHTAKRAAVVFGRSHRTVQDWLQGRGSMSADELLKRVAEKQELRAELVHLLGELDGPTDSHGRGAVVETARAVGSAPGGSARSSGAGHVVVAAAEPRRVTRGRG